MTKLNATSAIDTKIGYNRNWILQLSYDENDLQQNNLYYFFIIYHMIVLIYKNSLSVLRKKTDFAFINRTSTRLPSSNWDLEMSITFSWTMWNDSGIRFTHSGTRTCKAGSSEIGYPDRSPCRDWRLDTTANDPRRCSRDSALCCIHGP